MRRLPVAAAAIVSAVVTAAAGACSASRPATTTTSAVGTPAVVAGPPSRYDQIQVSAGARQAPVPNALQGQLAPLLIARNFGPQTALGDYGLDHPEAQLSYRSGATVVATVYIGAANFDRHGFYAKREADPDVYLLLADAIRPVLALVGIRVAPPST
jgi:hypothetical protein